jgi:hypothetical protein
MQNPKSKFLGCDITWRHTIARQINSSKGLKMQNSHRTCPLNHDRTHSSVRSLLPLLSACISVRHRLTGHTPCASVTSNFSVRSRTKAAPSLLVMTRCRVRVRSLQSQRPVNPKLLLHLFNFATLAQMCQPLSVSPCACVLAYFHKYFQGC